MVDPSGRQVPEGEVVLRRDAEGVSHAVEEREHRRHVNSFGDLVFAPTGIAQFLDVIGGRAVGRPCDQFNVVQQGTLGGTEACLLDFPLQDRGDALFGGSLNPQEVGVAVQSIRTAVEVGDVAGDHLLVPAGEVALGEMDSVREFDHLTQEIRAGAKALDDAGNLFPA
jgi:hypothetical protein